MQLNYAACNSQQTHTYIGINVRYSFTTVFYRRCEGRLCAPFQLLCRLSCICSLLCCGLQLPNGICLLSNRFPHLAKLFVGILYGTFSSRSAELRNL